MIKTKIKISPYSIKQKNAGFKAMKKLRKTQVPEFEQSFISDELLMNIVETVLTAALDPRLVK
jgi:hypothetical protein